MARRSSNTQRIGGLSHCVGCGVTQKKGGVQTPMGTRGGSQCFGCGVVGEGEVDIDDGNFYCFACWLAYYAARARSPNLRARLLQDTAHVQPARNLQGVAYAPGSAQHERSVGTVSPTLGRRPQLQRPDACMEHQQACTPITTPAAHARGREAEFT